MPYFVSNENADCSGWAVEKEDGEVMGCHRTRQEAIDQMVALSLAEDIEPGGERSAKQMQDDRRPPDGAREEAERGLEWRREYNRGGTEIGVARARDIANGVNLSEETVRRMKAYFDRHEVDKQGQGWSPDEDGYPSAGRIAWALWGGDAGRTWAERLVRQTESETSSAKSDETRRVTIVAGPPAAGKSTWVKAQAESGDLVVEWEAIVGALTGEPARSQERPTRELVGAMREAAIEKLAEQVTAGDAQRTWVIIGAPTSQERQQLADRLKADVVLVLCEPSVGRARIEADPSRPDEQLAALDRWWDAYEPQKGDVVVRTDERGEPEASSTRSAMQPQQKSVRAKFQIKADAQDAPNGEVTALVSVFGNEDLVGDRMVKGAFAKSLNAIKDAGRSIPFVWSHQWSDPNAYIGKVLDAEETDDGLLVRASLFDTATAQHIKTLLKEGVVTEFSFAYDVIKQRAGKDGVNELTEVHILEAGPTLKGANPATQLVNVRSALSAQVDAKAGRVLSTKNESRIRDAVVLLDEVLGSLGDAGEKSAPEVKAEPGELDLGDFVTWEGDGYGRVEYVMLEGEFGVEGDPLSLEATPEDPLAMVRIYQETEDGYQPTDTFTGFRFSELTEAGEETDETTPGDEAPTQAAAALDPAAALALLELDDIA